MASAWLAGSWALWQCVLAGFLMLFLGKLQGLEVLQQISREDTLSDQIPGILT
jgi:hypothetical protein